LVSPIWFLLIKIENRLGFTKKRGKGVKMFYTAFYVIVMIVLAVLNGIQFGASKGLGFRKVANVFQMLVFVAVPTAYVVGGQTSAFHFWTIIAFFICAVIDVVELTLVSCGKIKNGIPTTKSPEESAFSDRKGVGQRIRKTTGKIVQKNPRASHALGVVCSLLLTVGVFIVSIALVTGYFFQ
jgi:hypothetical protein